MSPSPALAALLLLAAGCAPDPAPRLETPADSLAARIAEAHGGLAAWQSLPVLRFDWVVATDSAELRRVHHVWDKAGDRTRVEWSVGEDSTLVAVFAPGAFDAARPAGAAALNGQPLAGADLAERLEEGHRRHINDTYWLLAPLKALDPGVRRALAPDSGAGVLALSFDAVGLTPGDRYWLFTDDAGAVTGWTFLLEGDSVPGRFAWTEPAELPTPRGALRLPVAKVRAGGGPAIRTEPQAVPDSLEAVFADLAPRFSR